MSFMSRWWKGTKSHASSPSGGLQTGLIITGFVVVGCLLGAWQVKLSNGYSAVAFLLFAFGLLNLSQWFMQLKQYRLVRQQEKLFKEMKQEEERR